MTYSQNLLLFYGLKERAETLTQYRDDARRMGATAEVVQAFGVILASIRDDMVTMQAAIDGGRGASVVEIRTHG